MLQLGKSYKWVSHGDTEISFRGSHSNGGFPRSWEDPCGIFTWLFIFMSDLKKRKERDI